MTLYQTTVGKPAAATVVLGLGLCSGCTITEGNGTEREATFQESMDQANEGLGAVTEAAESTADFVTAVSNIYCVITGKCPVRDTEGRYDEPAPPPPGPAPPWAPAQGRSQGQSWRRQGPARARCLKRGCAGAEFCLREVFNYGLKKEGYFYV